MVDIFISYRRQDAAGWVLGLARDLRTVFPDSHVFHDIASIAIGEDFLEAIERSLQSCGVVLVVSVPIGWTSGMRRAAGGWTIRTTGCAWRWRRASRGPA